MSSAEGEPLRCSACQYTPARPVHSDEQRKGAQPSEVPSGQGSRLCECRWSGVGRLTRLGGA
eukprot:966471-Alexandrium_andersonii.AAC.1